MIMNIRIIGVVDKKLYVILILQVILYCYKNNINILIQDFLEVYNKKMLKIILILLKVYRVIYFFYLKIVVYLIKFF